VGEREARIPVLLTRAGARYFEQTTRAIGFA
jgi:hypothetical protein